MNIIVNRIQTPDGTIIYSRYRHDYVEHLDKNGLVYAVDGGTDYLRRIEHKNAPYKEMSLYESDDFEIIREVYCRGSRGKDGNEELKWIPISKMSTDYLLNCLKYNYSKGITNCIANKMYIKELQYRIEREINIIEE